MERGEVVCLMCGTVVGEVRNRKFAHHTGCERPLRLVNRLPRCCRCGGSLFFDPVLLSPRYAGLSDTGLARTAES